MARSASFWLVILAINLSSFLALMEGTIISNALPTIVEALHSGNTYVWVGSAYSIACAALMPATGALAQAFGRKSVTLASITIFSLGCVLCGAASSMSMLIAGRTIQGLGGAGIFTTSAIILSDLVPLSERGLFNGLYQITWCLASAIGPIVGGALSETGQWRWVFYLNLPIALVAGALVLMCLHLKTPGRTWAEIMDLMDWTGNFLIISCSTSIAIALTWAGLTYAWSSWHVLVPLCIGGVGLVAFLLYESWLAKQPLVPVALMGNRTTLSGYLQTFILPIPFLALVYYLPLYFQVCKGFSPIKSGVNLFGLCFSAPPFAVIAGISVKVTQRYRPQIWFGWITGIIGMGLLGSTSSTTSVGTVIGFEIIAGAGYGAIFSALYFPVLAPLPISSNALALAFFSFVRVFAQIWGITIGGVILQNQLVKNLPQELLTQFSLQSDVVFDVIPLLQELEEPLLGEVRAAFASGIRLIWQVMAGISGLGLLISLFMRHMSLHTSVDSDWGEKQGQVDQPKPVDAAPLAKQPA
ncbi:MFS general substrate transporter [Armillaria novae-zelandiae]|uniref:MFS general substrate transporter n=1 Tax=Armillaria novae-zelandiae TaxID=153914 RepID=A0AA39NWM6_9AGAR|nr:MFS general substrate transporter [Armillaria novae-zelandiae]